MKTCAHTHIRSDQQQYYYIDHANSMVLNCIVLWKRHYCQSPHNIGSAMHAIMLTQCISSASPCTVILHIAGQPPAWLPRDGHTCPPLTTWAAWCRAGRDVCWSLWSQDALKMWGACSIITVEVIANAYHNLPILEAKSVVYCTLVHSRTHHTYIPTWYHDGVEGTRTAGGRGETEPCLQPLQNLQKKKVRN